MFQGYRTGVPQTRVFPNLASTLDGFFSIETCFVLFLFAGRYKELPELNRFPVDFTVLFFAATLWLMTVALISRKLKPLPLNLPIIAMVAFSALAVLSLFWSSLDTLNTDKAVRFLLFTSTSFFFSVILSQDPDRRARLVRMILWLSCALLVYYAYYRYARGIDLADKEDENYANNYLEYGSHAEILFISLVCIATLGRPKQAFGAVVGSTIALFALASIGGRGPFAAALLSIPLLMIALVLRRKPSVLQVARLLSLVGILTCVAVLGYIAIGGLSSSSAEGVRLNTLERYELELEGESTGSMDVRSEGRRHAFQKWLEKPILGWGFGEFRVQDSFLQYPHNILLEILMESGLMGAFLFLLICAATILYCARWARSGNFSWVDAAIILIFLPELGLHLTVQGYLGDDRAFFAYIGLATAIGQNAIEHRAFARPRPGHASKPKTPVLANSRLSAADRTMPGR
jgi:O-antigen ligase